MLKTLFVAGARPNFMKIAPLLKACEKSPGLLDPVLVHTGQHYDDALSRVFFHELGIGEPAVNLGVGSGSHAQQTARIMMAFEPVCLAHKPHWVVVVGDVNSTAACALVAAKLHLPVAHVEAGLRSNDRTMPEEINRLITDALADLLLCTEESAVANLLREGRPPGAIHLVGNVMADTLLAFRQQALAQKTREALGLGGPFGLVTLHRPENVDNADKLAALLRLLAQAGTRLPLVFPVHPRTQGRLDHLLNEAPIAGVARLGPGAPVSAGHGLFLTPPLPYLAFLNLMQQATVVLTDSGGVQEETTVLGVPCLTLRRNTERPVTVDLGTNTVVGTDPAVVLAELEKILAGQGKHGRVPPLWDGGAADRTVALLAQGPPGGGVR